MNLWGHHGAGSLRTKALFFDGSASISTGAGSIKSSHLYGDLFEDNKPLHMEGLFLYKKHFMY